MAAISFAGTSLSFLSGHGLRRKNPKLVVANSVRASYRNSSEDLRVDPKVGALLDTVKWDNKGLAVTIAQNIDTGAILMQGFANKEALAMTISSRKATFYSRSRSSLWTKGETSSNFINVHDIFLDCDRDSIIYLGKPDGPTCHTGSETCYYSSLFDLLEEPQASKERLASTTLYSLEATISQRKDEAAAVQNGKPSWTKRLLLDRELLSSKVREEAGELIQTLLENEDRSRTTSEGRLALPLHGSSPGEGCGGRRGSGGPQKEILGVWNRGEEQAKETQQSELMISAPEFYRNFQISKLSSLARVCENQTSVALFGYVSLFDHIQNIRIKFWYVSRTKACMC